METLLQPLRAHPELAVFLTLGVGYWVGKLALGGFKLGAVAGVLLTGVVVGQIGAKVSDDLKQVMFLLFLFSIGYKVGPQFFRGFRSGGAQQMLVTVVFCVAGLLAGWACAKIFGYDMGTAAGLLAGALTESATIGVASDAMGKLGLSPEEVTRLTGNAASAFAVCYLVGTVGAVLMLSRLGPMLAGADIAAACREYEKELGTISAGGAALSVRRQFIARAIRLHDALGGTGIAALEARLRDETGARLFIGRIRRGEQFLEADLPAATLMAGDVVTLSGPRAAVVAVLPRLGEEVDDEELLDVPADVADVVVTSASVDGRTLAQLGESENARGVFLRSITRAGQPLPIAPNLEVQQGDILRIVGSVGDVARVAAELGHIDRPTTSTDMVFVGIGILLGGLIGIPALHLGPLELGLGVSVGVLVGGLVFGWLRSVRRTFGFIPEPALWLFDSLGLNGFIAVVGINAGPTFVAGLVQTGPTLVVAALVTLFVAQTAGILFGARVLRMHPGVLLGVIAGAGTSGAALAAVQEAAGSKIPTLGYGVPYAVGNVLLALWGSIIVALLA